MTFQKFDEFQFHDNSVHGISFILENFIYEMHLDIDHILRWPDCNAANGRAAFFTVSRGILKFADVTDLSINIEWGDSGYSTAVSGMMSHLQNCLSCRRQAEMIALLDAFSKHLVQLD